MSNKATIIYPPQSVHFEPDTGYPFCKMGFENRRLVNLLLEPDTASAYTQYQVFGAVSGDGAWRNLPAASNGYRVATAALCAEARLIGALSGPFALAAAMSMSVVTLDAAGKRVEETFTINDDDYEDAGAATADEVADAFNAQVAGAVAEAVADAVMISAVRKPDGFLQLSSIDGLDELLGFGQENNCTCYSIMQEVMGEPSWRGLSAEWKRICVRFRKQKDAVEGEEEPQYDVSEVVSDWVVLDTVCPILPKHVRNLFGFGVPIMRADGVPFPDVDLYRICLASISKIEQFMHVFLTPVRLMTNATARTPAVRPRFDYDLSVDPYDWKYPDMRSWSYMPLRHYPIIGTPSIKLVYINGQPVVDIPAQWLKVYHRTGQLHITPGGTSLSNFAIGVGGQFLPIYGTSQHSTIPQYIWVDYSAGFASGQLPPAVWDACCKLAAVSLFQINSDAHEFGTAGRSLSDGVISQSWSGTGSGGNPLMGARIQQYQKELQEFERLYRGKFRRPTMAVV